MRLLFHLGHPAHFHLFKNVISYFKENGDEVLILIKKKDTLEELLIEAGLDYNNILPGGRKNTRVGLILGILKQTIRLLMFCIRWNPDILIGCTPSIAHVGKILNKRSINLSEDDVSVVKISAQITFPFSTHILSPNSCDNGNWNKKTTKYNSYHELAYLHPNNFIPNIKFVNTYNLNSRQYFVLRFSSLEAYHDDGIKGISVLTAMEIVEKLKPHGKIIISSEKTLVPELEVFRININPLDMHHILAYAALFIGDSQTMAAEAAILGTPFIRINDFVGRLGYLNELENKYKLGFGIKPKFYENIFQSIEYILSHTEYPVIWKEKRKKLLEEKVDFAEYLISYIKELPFCFN